jgi:methylated-DNA-protein-cysteine methyltransferase-like protein
MALCGYHGCVGILDDTTLLLIARIGSKINVAKDMKSRNQNLPTKNLLPSGKKEESFFEQVYAVARQIPRGRVTSYGAIAASLGAKSSARMVGWAMNGAHQVKPKVPAHRVVNRVGLLSGKHHFATPDTMQQLLEKEGVKVKDDQVVEFAKVFWDPMREEI